MLLSLAIRLQNTNLFEFLRDSDRGYQIILSLHLACISLFAAMIVVTDLRLLGWGMRGESISDIVNQLRVPKRIGFVLAATCGFLVFGMKAEEYYYNDFFRVKILLFALVAVHALVFRRSIYNKAAELNGLNQPPARARLAAGLSLVLWLCIVCAGRGIGYIHAPVFSHHFAMLFEPAHAIKGFHISKPPVESNAGKVGER
jgi:hypothetical protein